MLTNLSPLRVPLSRGGAFFVGRALIGQELPSIRSLAAFSASRAEGASEELASDPAFTRAFSARPESQGFTNGANSDSYPVVSLKEGDRMGWVSGRA
jgi:hypothetical protein